MKSGLVATTIVGVLAVGSSAFAPMGMARRGVMTSSSSSTERFMFGGAGAAAPKEDEAMPELTDEQKANMEGQAKMMGMSIEEYSLAMQARQKMEEAINNIRAVGGTDGKVTIEYDGNTPAKHMEVTITDAGKALGKAALEKEIVSAVAAAKAEAKTASMAAQTNMMEYIKKQLEK